MKRSAYRWMMLFVMLLVGLPAAAQDGTLGLSDADYALLMTANRAVVNRVSFDFNAQLAVQGLDTFAINADINGTGALDTASPALILSLNGDLNLGARYIPVRSELRWLDDTLYLNPGDGWQAIEGASRFAADAIAQYTGLHGEAAAIGLWEFDRIEGMNEIIAALMTIDPASFVMAQRLDDETLNGVQVAHFQMTADLHALMQTEGFVNLVGALALVQGTNLVIYNHDELGEIVRANSALFDEAMLIFDQYIGVDDSAIYRIVLTLNMPLDPSRTGYPDAPFMVTAQVDMMQSNHNQPQEIAAPDGATIGDSFTFSPPAALETPDDDITQSVFFETIGDGESFLQSFQAEAGDIITVTVRGLGLEFDPYVAILSESGDILSENDDHESTAFGVNDLDSQIVDFSIPETGTYSVEVAEINAAVGSFVLTIRVRR